MSHSSQERDRSKNNSYKTRSNATCSTTDTQRSIMKAAVRKAELKCRQKALKKTAELEKRALEVKQEMKMQEINTELEVEDAKIAAYENFSNHSQSSSNESDPMTHSEKKVKDWLYDDKNTPVLKNTVLLEEPVPDIGLRPPMQRSENKDQYASPMPFAWKLDTDKHELSSPPHRMAQCEVSQSLQHPERTSQHHSPLRWKPNMNSYEKSPPLQYMKRHEISSQFQYMKQPETSPIQRSERRDQCTFPMQGTPNMFETTSTPVIRSSNPFANHMSSVPLANNAISQPMLHTYRDYGGMQHGTNYVPSGPAVGPNLNPFVNSMSSEPFENNTTDQSMSRMNGDYGVMHQQEAHRPMHNSSRDDTAKILEKLRQNQREAAPPPQKQTPAVPEVINQQSPSSTAFPIDAPTPLRPAAPRMTRMRFPTFNGDLKDYNRFKRLFNHCTAGMAELDTFYQLTESMERKQERDKIKGCINLKRAWQVLDEVYGDQGKLVDSLLTEVDNLRMYEKGGKPHLPEMSTFVQTLQNFESMAETMGLTGELNSRIMLSQIKQKMPEQHRIAYLKSVRDDEHSEDSISGLVRWLHSELTLLEKAKHAFPDPPPTKSSDSRRSKNAATVDSRPYNLKETQSSKGRHCPLHPQAGTHYLNNCNKFQGMKLDQKYKIMKEHKICFRCGHDNCTAGKHPYDPTTCQFVASCRVATCGADNHFTAICPVVYGDRKVGAPYS